MKRQELGLAKTASNSEGFLGANLKISAIVAVMLLTFVVLFQIGLALGAPFGRAAWGGQHEGVLPTRLRIASGVSALIIYPLIAVAVLEVSGVADWDVVPWSDRGVMWVLTGLFVLGGLANLASRSPRERYWLQCRSRSPSAAP